MTVGISAMNQLRKIGDGLKARSEKLLRAMWKKLRWTKKLMKIEVGHLHIAIVGKDQKVAVLVVVVAVQRKNTEHDHVAETGRKDKKNWANIHCDFC